MRATSLVLISCLATGPALAQSVKPRGEAAPTVSPVTVMPPTQTPKVVSTWPATGQAVKPGVLVLKVTFDQPMTPRDFSYGLGAGTDALSCLKTPRLLADGKTFALLCTTLPGKAYAVALNGDAGGAASAGFSNLAENRAESSQLAFSTLTGEPVTKLREAIRAAGLGELDVPVEEAPQQAAHR